MLQINGVVVQYSPGFVGPTLSVKRSEVKLGLREIEPELGDMLFVVG